MKKILFLGPLYPPHKENEILEKTILGGSNAPNVFQWNLIDGLYYWIGDGINVINVLPVGIWMKEYKSLILRDNDWTSNGIIGHEIGCVNLPFIKQYIRFIKIKRILEKDIDEDTEVIIYSAYLPFLKAAYRLRKEVKITAIITDLPEFSDLQKTSKVRAFFRNLQNRMIYKYLNRVDRFVVLTKQMCEPLHIENRPWICIEGICNSNFFEESKELNGIKAILYSGTLHYQYGIKNLLEAFEQITIENIELWICGRGEAAKEIQDLSKKDSRIKFFGFCSQNKVAELRANAAILVNPRTNEGEYTKYSFPSKTMEYMASGKPVIMYKLDGIPNEYDPYLFFAKSDNLIFGLKDTIIDVLENYDEAIKKASKAQKFIIENKNGISQANKILNWLNNDKKIYE